MTKRNLIAAIVLAATLPIGLVAWAQSGAIEGARELAQLVIPKRTVADVLEQRGPTNRVFWKSKLKQAGLDYPPTKVVLVALKEERRLEVYATPMTGPARLVDVFPILAASGGPGPKLREGDRQVPEGLYGIESLNPNSRFHLSLRVNYPNTFDRRMAANEGRTNLGGDIMIHGSNVSIGCLAMGDEVAEKLFVLAADTGIKNLSLLMCPHDFRVKPVGLPKQSDPKWLVGVYEELQGELGKLPAQGH